MRENPLLAHIAANNVGLPPTVTIPPGDDMGAITFGNSTLLVTVDQLCGGVHIDLAQFTVEDACRKAVRRSLSDIAAMGCVPVAAVATACLPRDMPQEQASRLADAMREDAAAFDCPLIGGDVSAWDHPMLLTVTAFARPAANANPLLRSTAKPGHAICVTGRLGGSQIIQEGDALPHHIDFTPRITAGLELAARFARHAPACMDLSDGIAKDLERLCTASNASAEIDLDKLPCRDAIADTPEPWRHALGDGEDYELLFTLPPDAVPDELAGTPVTVIGRIKPPEKMPTVSVRKHNGQLTPIADLGPLGWEHGS